MSSSQCRHFYCPLIYTRWGIISGTSSAKWQNFVITLICIKIFTTKREITLRAMPLNLPTSPCFYRVISASAWRHRSWANCVCRCVGSGTTRVHFVEPAVKGDGQYTTKSFWCKNFCQNEIFVSYQSFTRDSWSIDNANSRLFYPCLGRQTAQT